MKLTLALVLALAAVACGCGPDAAGSAEPQGWEGKWTGELTEAPQAAPDAPKADADNEPEQDAPSFNDDLANMLGGYELELRPDKTFSLSMAGVEVSGEWEEATGSLALTPKTVMGDAKADAKPELADFFAPIAADLDKEKKEIRLRAGEPWPDVDFRRAGAGQAE